MFQVRLSLLIATQLVCQSAAQSLHTPDRIWQRTKLVDFSDEGWRFRSSDGQRIAPKDVVRWGAWRGVRDDQAIWLSDGSWICGDVSFLASGDIAVKSDWLDCPTVPLSAVRGIILDPPASPAAWQTMQTRMLDASGDQDLLWLTARRKLSGIIRWPQGEEPGKRLLLESGKNELDFPLTDIRAAVFSPALVGLLPDEYNGLTIGLKDGSAFRVRSVRVIEGKVQIVLASGLMLTSYDDTEEFASSVRYIADAPAKTRNLADLQLASYKHVSDQTLSWEMGINRDAYGRPLTTREGQIQRGLAMHSSSRAAFRWDGNAGRLLAEVVFAKSEAAAKPDIGSVACQVLLARNGKLDHAANFTMSRSGKHRSSIVDVDITGAQLIVLVTDQSDFGQFGDHVLWQNARISQ